MPDNTQRNNFYFKPILSRITRLIKFTPNNTSLHFKAQTELCLCLQSFGPNYIWHLYGCTI